MFFLSMMEHTMKLPPRLLNRLLNVAIKEELESIFLDRIIDQLGLCVSVYDIQSIDDGFIFPGDGAPTYTVKFRLVMFRPFEGEIILAKLLESTKDVSLGFFEDIYVPVSLLPSPIHSEPDPILKDSVTWIWEYDGQKYPIDGADEIRFKVHNVSYPPIPLVEVEEEEEQQQQEEEEQEEEEVVRPFAPMVITGFLDGDGLGPVSWW